MVPLSEGFVRKSSPGRRDTCLLIGPHGLSEVTGGQEPSEVQNIWHLDRPGWVVILLSQFLETSSLFFLKEFCRII